MTVLVDTGPLVALLNRRDHHHRWAVAEFGRVKPLLHCCEAVLAEAHHLLARVHEGGARLNQLLDTGRFDLSFRYADHTRRVHQLMQSYSDVPMSFAGSCLVALAEQVARPVVLTLDTDFTLYRRKRNRKLDLIIP